MAIDWDAWEVETKAGLDVLLSTPKSAEDAASALATFLRERVQAAFDDAEVTISGVDSNGDTHDGLTGTVS